jgi:hypothetical protein
LFAQSAPLANTLGGCVYNNIEILERSRRPRGDRSVQPKRRVAVGVRRRHGLQSQRLRYWAGRLSRAEGPARRFALAPATVVGAEFSAVIRAGEITIELSSATPEQVATIAQVHKRLLCGVDAAKVASDRDEVIRPIWPGSNYYVVYRPATSGRRTPAGDLRKAPGYGTATSPADAGVSSSPRLFTTA